jgi:uncharacterized secreted protein with C-terminal beta-propeller domain
MGGERIYSETDENAPFTGEGKVYIPVDYAKDIFKSVRIERMPTVTRDGIKYVELTALAELLQFTSGYFRGLAVIGNEAEVAAIGLDRERQDELIAKLNALPVIGSEAALGEILADLDGGYEVLYEDVMMGTAIPGGTGMAVPSMDAAFPVSPADPAAAPEMRQPPASIDSAYAESSSAVSDEAETAGFSATNVQVAGVDEGDIIKTDGEYIYYLKDNRLSVVKAVPADDMELVYTLEFTDENFWPEEIYTDGGTVTVAGSTLRAEAIFSRRPSRPMPGEASSTLQADADFPSYDSSAFDAEVSSAPLTGDMRVSSYYYPRTRPMTRVYVYDITDKSDIKLLKNVVSEGGYVTSRVIDGMMYAISRQYAYSLLRDDGYATPEYSYGLTEDSYAPIGYGQIYRFPFASEANYLTITGINLRDDSEAKISTYFGAGDNVYVSGEHMYIAAPKYDYDTGRQLTRVYKFSLSGGNALFMFVNQVNGNILNQFSMDEYDGFFRIATTSYDENYNSVNHLYIYDETLSPAGEITGIAPGEQIYSTRFMGAKGYMVTFRTVDPLFSFDLSDPYHPKLTGALKIPGYSDYLHPYDENHLIGFGKDAAEYYGNAYYLGMKLSLFDITDPENPVEMFTETIGGRGTESELLSNHRALLFSREKGLLAFPVTVFTEPEKGAAPYEYGAFESQGAFVYDIDLEKGFTLRGQITHMSREDSLKAGYYGGDSQKYVQRMIYIGDTLYTVSNQMIKANSLNDLSQTGEVGLY